MTRQREQAESAQATVVGGPILPERHSRLLRFCVEGSELSVTGDTDARWTLIITHRPGQFELEFMETEGGGLLRGEGPTLAEAVEAARGSR